MHQPIEVHVVRVFVDKQGSYGSPSGIVIDEARVIAPERRQAITHQLGFSETIFINSLANSEVSIFSLTGEIPFAGAPLVGTVWFIEKTMGKHIDVISCQGNQIKVVHDEDLVWVMAEDLSILPAWKLEQLSSADEVEKIKASERPKDDHSYVWAWIDQSYTVARVQARTFAPGWDIPEEEANGSGSMLLAHKLGRSLLIKHGEGSYIRATAGTTGVAVGGLCKEDPSLSI